MNIAFYTGASGLGAFQEYINLIGNNLSNSNTAGYKPVQADFENLLYTRMYVNSDQRPLEGTGVRVRGGNLIMEQGSMRQTERALDFAIAGEGFFGVERGGAVSYTRDGEFAMSKVGDDYYLTTVDGAFVLDQQGQRIQLPMDDNDMPNTENLKDRLGVFQFANPEALQPMTSNRYVPTAQSGAAQVATDQENYKILTQTIELSKVSVADEMTDMIMAQRGFQFSARVVQASDEIEDIVNNLRK